MRTLNQIMTAEINDSHPVRFHIKSEKTQGENWHYICDSKTGGFVDLFPNLAKAQERCKALNDGRVSDGVYRPITNIAAIVARQIGGEL